MTWHRIRTLRRNLTPRMSLLLLLHLRNRIRNQLLFLLLLEARMSHTRSISTSTKTAMIRKHKNASKPWCLCKRNSSWNHLIPSSKDAKKAHCRSPRKHPWSRTPRQQRIISCIFRINQRNPSPLQVELTVELSHQRFNWNNRKWINTQKRILILFRYLLRNWKH